MSQKEGIKFYTAENAKIGNRITFSDDYKTLSGMENIFTDIRKRNYKARTAKRRKDFEKIRDNPEPPAFTIEEKKWPVGKNRLIAFKILRSLSFTIKSVIPYEKPAQRRHDDRKSIFLFRNAYKKIRGLRNLQALYDEWT